MPIGPTLWFVAGVRVEVRRLTSAVTVPKTGSNWLFALYYGTRASADVRKWAEAVPSTLIVSGPVLAECRCNFWRAGDRAIVLEADLRAKRLVDCGYTFEELVSSAEQAFHSR